MSKRVPIFDRGTGSKPERLRSGSLQADLSLIVYSDPPARVSVQAPRFSVIYDSQFPLASSRFGRDSIQYRVGKTHCPGHQDPSKRVPIFKFLGTPEALIKMPGSYWRGSYFAESYCILERYNKRYHKAYQEETKYMGDMGEIGDVPDE